MAVETIELQSQALRGPVKMNVLVPEAGRTRYPVVYVLHGLGDTFATYFANTDLEAFAADHEMIIVTPEGDAGWYCNDPRERGMAWEDHVAREVVDHVDAAYPTIARRDGRAMAGFSMGGYGAMMLALKHVDRFAAVCAQAGSFAFGHQLRPDRPERSAFMRAVAPPGGSYDVFTITERLASAGRTALAIRFVVGRADHLLQINRAFHAHLTGLGIAHEYEEVEGGHQWCTVNRQLPAALAYLAGRLSPAE